MASKRINLGDGTANYVRTADGGTGGAVMDPSTNFQVHSPSFGMFCRATGSLGAGGTGGGELLPIKRHAATVTATGANAFLTAVASKYITVLGYRLQNLGTGGTAARTISFVDTGTPTAIPESPTYTFTPSGGIAPGPWPGNVEFQCPVGTGMQVNLTAGTDSFFVQVFYVESSTAV